MKRILNSFFEIQISKTEHMFWKEKRNWTIASEIYNKKIKIIFNILFIYSIKPIFINVYVYKSWFIYC